VTARHHRRRLVERWHAELFAVAELLDLRDDHLALRELDEVALLLPREVADHPRDRIDRREATCRLLRGYRLEPAPPFAAREAELGHERMRHQRSTVFIFIVASPCSMRPPT
jgi:hypothetical protein